MKKTKLITTVLCITGLHCSSTLADNVTEFKVGVPIISGAGTPYDIERVGPAIQMGFDKVNSEVLNSSYRLVKIERHYGSSCSASRAPGIVADMYHMENIVGLIGPACAHALAPVGELAYYWNIPIVTGLGDSGVFENKTAYPILTRLAYCQCRLRKVFGSVFVHFNWVDIALVYDHNDVHSSVLGATLRGGLQKQLIYPYVITFYGNTDYDCRQILRQAATRSRVILLIVTGNQLREFMLAALELGYIQKGEFVFMDVELFPFPGDYWGNHSWERGDELDAKAKLAYTALLRIALNEPTSIEWAEFTENVKTLSQDMYNFTFGAERVNFFVGAFYDAVYLYGLALNETLTEGGDPRDGYKITRMMWNRSFTGVSGEVLIDDNGDRDTSYTILDMDLNTGQFQVVANFGGDRQIYVPVPSKKIHWSGGRESPPLNEPLCGFLGDKCYIEEGISSSSVILIVLVTMIVIILVILVCGIRLYRREKAIQSMSWTVTYKDIKHYKRTHDFSKLSMEKGSKSEMEESTTDGHLPEQLFANVCIYKGILVVVRKLTVHKLEMKRALILEFKQMQDLHHPNLVKFVGACLEPGSVCILTEYCSKGSLQDVLYNDEITLDWTFRLSLLKDIVTGLAYIHGSDIRYHGKLRSSNCVIDSRFVVKLTDFGLRGVNDILAKNTERTKEVQRLLCVAPEFLRTDTSQGSREGDIYSFGIIIEEVSSRAGPYDFYARQMEPSDILMHVKQGGSPSFRPKIVNTECPGRLEKLAAQCWSEDPACRPNIQMLQKQLKALLGGRSDNLVDALLRRMEQYASNLEQIVQERTQQLLVEKRRSDELLYQILPRSVAERLKTGQSVIPEAFENVTVFFSDIVGFTAMSSCSTPFQIVDFLNDLYTVFDSTIENYNVYKVETIGDAYMVVSGLPLRNGDLHAPEICRLALRLLAQIKTFVIKHMPSQILQLRIGMHSGPCVAGVVGLKMPRYCLFGDTVNTASRMETNGQAQKVHISSQTKALLDRYSSFQTEYRGQVNAKGKGLIDTYWLLNEITDTN